MKKLTLPLLFIFLFNICMPSFANIESFLEEIEEEEKTTSTKPEPAPKEKLPQPKPAAPAPAPPHYPKEKPLPPRNKPLPPPVTKPHYAPSHSSSDDSLCLGLCADVLFDSAIEILAQVITDVLFNTWFTLNANLNFGSYPYCEEGYLQSGLKNKDNSGLSQPYKTNGLKLYRGYIDVSAFAMSFTKQTTSTDSTNPAKITFRHIFDELSYGVDAEIHTYLVKYIGLDAEAWTIGDTSGRLSGGRLGARFSGIQTEHFAFGAYFHAVFWHTSKLLEGGALGLDFEIYPAEPVIILARSGLQILDDDLTFFETDISFGFIIDRFEVFGAYRLWLLIKENAASHPYHGGRVGIRTYF